MRLRLLKHLATMFGPLLKGSYIEIQDRQQVQRMIDSGYAAQDAPEQGLEPEGVNIEPPPAIVSARSGRGK